MDIMTACAMGEAHRNERMRTFDWNEAARILRERNPAEAEAGLQSDLEWTCGTIWRDGQPVTDSYTYLASTWATPVLVIDDEEIECWCWADEREFNADTKWPESARAILSEDPGDNREEWDL